jgi:hypothetical protein
MVKLARAISLAIIDEYGSVELLRRFADPLWFQAFGCVLGYDWHSSGVTTVVCAALKEAYRPIWKETGLFVAGGKGATSRKTPNEIEALGTELRVPPAALIYASRMSAKVDNNALQDGYQIHHHTFIFDREGRWAVVQQGMNEKNGWAPLSRRPQYIRSVDTNSAAGSGAGARGRQGKTGGDQAASSVKEQSGRFY